MTTEKGKVTQPFPTKTQAEITIMKQLAVGPHMYLKERAGNMKIHLHAHSHGKNRALLSEKGRGKMPPLFHAMVLSRNP